MEKLALSLVHTARRLRRYFQANPIKVITDQPIRTILERPETSGRLAKWAIEVVEHKIDTEGYRAGLVLVDPEGKEFTYALRLDFPSTNNEAEYEALLAGLRIAKEMKVSKIQVFVDSLLIASQVHNQYLAKEESMKKYKATAQGLMQSFESYSVKQVPRSKNKQADALSKLTFAHLTKKVLVEVLKAPSICEEEIHDVITEEEKNWMTPVIDFLKEEKLPDDEAEAARLQIKAKLPAACTNQSKSEARSGDRYLNIAVLQMGNGHCWPIPRSKRKSQVLAGSGRLLHQVAQGQTTSFNHGKTAIAKQVINFVWEQIICRFGLPGQIVTDNGKQFADKPFSSWCTEMHIKQIFSSAAYPQSNGQVERMNRSIVSGIKARLGRHDKDWLEELPSVLWAVRTTQKTSYDHTPYNLVFGSEAVIPAEIGKSGIMQESGRPDTRRKWNPTTTRGSNTKVSKLEIWYSETMMQADNRILESWALNGKVLTRLQKHTEEVRTNLMTWKEKGFQNTRMTNTCDASSYKP
ncbi:hypothetical protein L1987_38151 [Smallanthus sonchifolius]|uniref:Uncharacterized protein n=1 Tax=Smallanthus sonchifolius TaxID=185202 RepID=A0ACB9HJM1_9ASTR|nr:hypothetical protein L1987_38151 [Smallanthus sonchifolius]